MDNVGENPLESTSHTHEGDPLRQRKRGLSSAIPPQMNVTWGINSCSTSSSNPSEDPLQLSAQRLPVEVTPQMERNCSFGKSSISSRYSSEGLLQLNTQGIPSDVSLRPHHESIYSLRLSSTGSTDHIQPGLETHSLNLPSNDLPDLLDNPQLVQHASGTRTPSGEEGSCDQHPTSEKEKKNWFFHSLFKSLGLIYAIMLTTIAVILYVADVMMKPTHAYAEAFNIYLIVLQLAYLIYIHIDTRQYISLVSKELKKVQDESASQENGENERATEDNVFHQHYGFTTGRHGGSLYLKIGATVFCCGYMIQGGLELGQKILFVTDEDPLLSLCTNTTGIVLSVIRPLYNFYKLFFIYKFSNLIINRRISLSKFGIMHCGASSLCFWIYNILQETAHSLTYDNSEGDNSLNDSLGYQPLVAESRALYRGGEQLKWTLNIGCHDTTPLTHVLNTLTPYLFPFSIEFNIMMVGFWILLWENIGRIDRHTHIPSIEVTYEDEENKDKSLISNFIIYVDCHASLRGLFAGLMIIVATVISTIMFFIFSAHEDTAEIGIHINIYSELILFILMFSSSATVFYQMQRLDIITHSISYADDILLFTCLPFIFLFAMACTIPFVGDDLPAFLLLNILQIIQAMLQTALISDGLRRCSNSFPLQNKKPGRELIMFLVVTNLALWFLQSFQIRSKDGNEYAYSYYGKTLWTLLSHFTLPFVLFFRFHSSSCLADMWMGAYRVEEVH